MGKVHAKEEPISSSLIHLILLLDEIKLQSYEELMRTSDLPMRRRTAAKHAYGEMVYYHLGKVQFSFNSLLFSRACVERGSPFSPLNSFITS